MVALILSGYTGSKYSVYVFFLFFFYVFVFLADQYECLFRVKCIGDAIRGYACGHRILFFLFFGFWPNSKRELQAALDALKADTFYEG